MGLSRRLRREQQKNKNLRNLANEGKLADAYFQEEKNKLTHDVTTIATHRMIGMQLMVLHKYWGWGKTRLVRFLNDLVKFSGDMVTEEIKHSDIHATLLEECDIDFMAALDAIREQNSINVKGRLAELVDLRTKRLLGGGR